MRQSAHRTQHSLCLANSLCNYDPHAVQVHEWSLQTASSQCRLRCVTAFYDVCVALVPVHNMLGQGLLKPNLLTGSWVPLCTVSGAFQSNSRTDVCINAEVSEVPTMYGRSAITPWQAFSSGLCKCLQTQTNSMHYATAYDVACDAAHANAVANSGTRIQCGAIRIQQGRLQTAVQL